jgi:iron complex transport system substrate-binding protein
VDPNVEAILALRPDLVVGGRGPAGASLADRLKAHGIETYFPETEDFAGIDAMLAGLGARTGHVADAAHAVDVLHTREAAVEAAVRDLPVVRTVIVFGLEPIVVAGPGGFPTEMLSRAHGKNVVEEGSAYPIVGIERLIALDPDVVINAAMAEARGAERINAQAPGWKEMRAVKQGHVVAIQDESILRPGPRIGDGLAVIARALHPGAAVP